MCNVDVFGAQAVYEIGNANGDFYLLPTELGCRYERYIGRIREDEYHTSDCSGVPYASYYWDLYWYIYFTANVYVYCQARTENYPTGTRYLFRAEPSTQDYGCRSRPESDPVVADPSYLCSYSYMMGKNGQVWYDVVQP